jgi:hypothetical protein
MSALSPLGADGGEPLSLREISHEVTGHTLRVYGAVENRCPTEIQNLTVVIAPFGINKKAEDVLEALVEPAVVPGRERATFDVTTETVFLPGEYRVRFKIKDGPFLPHKDERSGAQPPPDEPAKAGK